MKIPRAARESKDQPRAAAMRATNRPVELALRSWKASSHQTSSGNTWWSTINLLAGGGREAFGQGPGARELGAIQEHDQIVLGQLPPAVDPVGHVVAQIVEVLLGGIGVEDAHLLAAGLEQAGQGRLGPDAIPVGAHVTGQDHPRSLQQPVEGPVLRCGEGRMSHRVGIEVRGIGGHGRATLICVPAAGVNRMPGLGC